MDKFNLERFLQAQEHTYSYALQELKEDRKRSHWIWYVFPQLKGLGRSYSSEYYGISGLDEAKAYIEHTVLGQRLMEVCEVIIGLPTNDAREVFGGIDSRKLRSSMTLFDLVSPDDVFAKVMNKFFDGRRCRKTLTDTFLSDEGFANIGNIC